MNSKSQTCPECGQKNLFATFAGSGAGHGAILLPRLGGLFLPAKMRIVVCGDCGLIRLYAGPEARAKLLRTEVWQRA